MSIVRARNILNGRDNDAIPLMDLPEHREFLKYLVGIDCMYDTENAVRQAVKKLDTDILMCSVPYTPANPEKNVNDKNLYGINPTAWRNAETTLFDVFSHNPLDIRPHLAVDDKTLTEMYIKEDARNRSIVGGTALTHGFIFTTCIHYAAEDLNYEEFLCECFFSPERINAELFDKYEALSAKQIRAWCNANVELMLCHDDIANTKATTLSVDFLRKYVFPRYKRLYGIAKEKGIPVLAMTDGNFIEVVKDYLDAGADGFFVDTPCVDMEKLINVAGSDKIYFTGPSPHIMTNGTPKAVAYEMDRFLEMQKTAKRLMMHMPGGWVYNMPVENVKMFYKKLGRI